MIIYRNKINEAKKIYKYLDKSGKEIKDKKTLDYLESLTIPPAYNDVEIFYKKAPKILFQGLDAKGRLQQIYSPKWRASADKEKFKALIDFGHKLPAMNLAIKKNISTPGRSKDKIISIILRIITLCGFRIGQLKYHFLYGSIGLSTLMKKHITLKKNKSELHIIFLGKKGVQNECVVTDKTLIAEIEKFAVDKKSHEFLFMYNEDGKPKHITPIDVNNWLKEYNEEFTSKFFRTFAVNEKFIEITRDSTISLPTTMTEAQRKKQVVSMIKDLSCSINNTPSICKKSYLDPKLIELYIQQPKKYTTNIIKNNYSPSVNFIKFLESNHA